MADDDLTPKQQRFVQEYLIDLNATDAARRAGYSARNAGKIGPGLLGKTRVAAAISAAQRDRAGRVELSQDWVIERLRGESQLEGKGASHSARVAALKLLGLHLGMFPRKHQVTGADGKPLLPSWEDLARMPRERLLELYRELARGAQP